MPRPDPLDDARALLILARLLHRYRVKWAGHGVQGAREAAERLVPLGKALSAAIEGAEQAEGDARTRALAEVATLGERLSSEVNDEAEGIRGLISVAIAGLRGEKSTRPTR